MYELFDWIFHLFHLSVIMINLTFWMSFRTLRIAQVSLALTLVSWFGFGLVYGFGYCFLTEWHWQVKELIGDTDLPVSYIKLVLDRTTGQSWDAKLVDKGTFAAFLISVTGCVVQSVRFYTRSGPR